MVQRGELQTVKTRDPQMGEGERFVMDGRPVQILFGVRNAGGQNFSDPTDVLLSPDGKVVTFVKSELPPRY